MLETVEDIQERRDQVLGRYQRFKEEAKEKRSLLEDSKRFQYFKRDADELESWILENYKLLQMNRTKIQQIYRLKFKNIKHSRLK